MKLLTKFLALSTILAVLALPARATVTLTFQAEDLLVGGANTSNVPAGSLVLLVADTTGAGFESLSPGNISTGAQFGLSDNDLVVAQLSISAAGIGNSTHHENVLNSSAAYTLSTAANDTLGDWTAGDALAIYWIPSLNSGATSVGLNVAYGMYTDSIGLNGSQAWITPPSGTANPMFFTTTGVFGSEGATSAASVGYAGFLTSTAAVPEPSTFGLLGGASALALAFVRRRKSG
jgi:hypothetical protein